MSSGQPAGTTPDAPGQTARPLRDLESGGTPENRWEYRRSTQVYTRWWAIQYYGIWFDGVRSRPVRWTLDDIDRVTIGGMTMYKEIWSWAYFDDINFRS